MFSDKEIFQAYGPDAVITRKGAFVLVHLDRPSIELLRIRTEEFDPDEYFCEDCPLCQMVKDSGVIIFDDSIFEENAVLD